MVDAATTPPAREGAYRPIAAATLPATVLSALALSYALLTVPDLASGI
jgi:hypothetical protein